MKSKRAHGWQGEGQSEVLSQSHNLNGQNSLVVEWGAFVSLLSPKMPLERWLRKSIVLFKKPFLRSIPALEFHASKLCSSCYSYTWKVYDQLMLISYNFWKPQEFTSLTGFCAALSLQSWAPGIHSRDRKLTGLRWGDQHATCHAYSISTVEEKAKKQNTQVWLKKWWHLTVSL